MIVNNKSIKLAMSEDSDLESSRSPKRRRINDNEGRYSSPDELAASSDHENAYQQRTRRASAEQLRRQSYDGSSSEDSPDELDHTIHTFWRDGWNRSQRPSRRQSRDAPSISTPSVDAPLTSIPFREVPSADVPSTKSPILSHRMATPPKKKPSFVRYRQKLVLRGHRRGVAAVRFSPDGGSIASCCE